MGRSAKLHKRVKKTASSVSQAHKASTHPSSASANTPSATSTSAAAAAAATAAKKRGLKAKAGPTTKRAPGQEGHVLGGADYVNLMMGSRKRAKEEAMKLPVD